MNLPVKKSVQRTPLFPECGKIFSAAPFPDPPLKGQGDRLAVARSAGKVPRQIIEPRRSQTSLQGF